MDLRMGIIGIGGLGYLQAKTYENMDGITIVGAADISQEARGLFEEEFRTRSYQNYPELLDNHKNEMDAVTIVTPHTLHYEQAKRCLEEGLHVLVEKPMTTDVSHAVELVELADDNDLVLQVGYQRHFHPGFQELRRLIETERIGNVHTVNGYLGQNWIDLHANDWRANPSLSGGGQLYDTGSHLLEALLWTLDRNPVSISAEITYAKPAIDTNSALAIRFGPDESVLAGVTISGDGIEVIPSEGYTFWGDGGRLAYNDGTITVVEKGELTYTTEVDREIDFQVLNQRKIENFVMSITGDTDPAVPGEIGITVTALTEAAYQADENECNVSIEEIIDQARSN